MNKFTTQLQNAVVAQFHSMNENPTTGVTRSESFKQWEALSEMLGDSKLVMTVEDWGAVVGSRQRRNLQQTEKTFTESEVLEMLDIALSNSSHDCVVSDGDKLSEAWGQGHSRGAEKVVSHVKNALKNRVL